MDAGRGSDPETLPGVEATLAQKSYHPGLLGIGERDPLRYDASPGFVKDLKV
jgi:hypothetical protein